MLYSVNNKYPELLIKVDPHFELYIQIIWEIYSTS
jgi:hypothetical protein